MLFKHLHGLNGGFDTNVVGEVKSFVKALVGSGSALLSRSGSDSALRQTRRAYLYNGGYGGDGD